MWWLKREKYLKDKFKWSDERSKHQAFYQSSQWVKTKTLKKAEHPLCECCLKGCSHLYPNPEKREILTPTYAIDHIIPMSVDYSLRLDYNNLQSLCEICHNKKTSTVDRLLKIERRIEDQMNNLNSFD